MPQASAASALANGSVAFSRDQAWNTTLSQKDSLYSRRTGGINVPKATQLVTMATCAALVVTKALFYGAVRWLTVVLLLALRRKTKQSRSCRTAWLPVATRPGLWAAWRAIGTLWSGVGLQAALGLQVALVRLAARLAVSVPKAGELRLNSVVPSLPVPLRLFEGCILPLEVR